MKKTLFSLLLVGVLLISTVSVAFADDVQTNVEGISKDSHKIKNKWDFAGTFTSSRGWDGAPTGSTWMFEIHIKEAVYSPYSKGVILFESGDNLITAHVEDMKSGYAYWVNHGPETTNNIAAVGWAEYNGEFYNFMFLYAKAAIWIALSDASYETEWANSEVWLWGGSERIYDLLSTETLDNDFDIDPKIIH